MKSLDRAKIYLLYKQPFFAMLLLHMKTTVTRAVDTAATNGVDLLINPEYWESLNEDEQIFLLAHEVMHPAMMHHTRCGDRDQEIWNYAADYAINLILKDGGLVPMKNILLDEKYRGMSAEEIYDKLVSQGQKQPQRSPKGGSGENGESGKGEGQDAPPQSQGESGESSEWRPGDGFKGSVGDVIQATPEELGESIRDHEILMAERVEQALEAARKQGKAPGGIDTFLEDLKNPKVHWADALRRLLSEKAADDYNWLVPNRMYSHTEFILPSLENETYGDVFLAVDTSGSLSVDELKEIASEIGEIHDFTQSKIKVIYCDTKVQHVDEFEAGDPLVLKAKGGGGTDFRPPFEWLEENDERPKLVVYFTDGYCYDFPEEPDYHVIWAITEDQKRREFKPPFGDVLYMNW